MDERKSVIRELKDKNRADSEAMDRLFENLGESLFQRIGEEEPFSGNEGEGPGGLLAEFRKLHSEIAESRDIIKSLEGDIQRLKELETEITGKEGEQTRLENEFDEVNVNLGKALLENAGSDDPLKPQEESLIIKVDELEKKQAELEGKEGGIFAWIGKNAQMAVSKGLILKNKFALQRLYRSAGENFIASGQEDPLEGETGKAAEKARELKEQLSSLAVSLAMLKGERRNMGDLFGAEGSPARRIQGQEKHIVHIQGLFPGVYRRFGSLASESRMSEDFSPFFIEEDRQIMERADMLLSQIEDRDLNIGKINAAISIDEEKAEIEKIRKAIIGQKQKIAAAEEAIEGLEKQIAESETRIDELDSFIKQSGGM